MRVKKRRIIGYGFRATKEKEFEVLNNYYNLDDLNDSWLSPNIKRLNKAIKEAREEGVFPQAAKARKFRLVLEEVEE